MKYRVVGSLVVSLLFFTGINSFAVQKNKCNASYKVGSASLDEAVPCDHAEGDIFFNQQYICWKDNGKPGAQEEEGQPLDANGDCPDGYEKKAWSLRGGGFRSPYSDWVILYIHNYVAHTDPSCSGDPCQILPPPGEAWGLCQSMLKADGTAFPAVNKASSWMDDEGNLHSEVWRVQWCQCRP